MLKRIVAAPPWPDNCDNVIIVINAEENRSSTSLARAGRESRTIASLAAWVTQSIVSLQHQH